jgi:hypothetical protein
LETLQRYNSPWERKIINIAGNHDIGYAGDVSEARLERFERVFGRANWDVRFQHPEVEGISNGTPQTATPSLHIINLNDLTLDGPALVREIQSDSYTYMNDVIFQRSHPVEDRTSFTLLLTHVPLHKPEGVCTDPPHFSFFHDDDNDGDDGIPRFKKDGLREQNHLSEYASANGVLQGIFGMSGDEHASARGRGRKGLILTGHDHSGCDVVHFVKRSSPDDAEDSSSDNASTQQLWHWDATRYSPSVLSSLEDSSPSIREVTLRSMMGEYGGNAALLSLWFDSDPLVNEWQYAISMCAAGVQHIWWADHGLGLACIIGLILAVALSIVEAVSSGKKAKNTLSRGKPQTRMKPQRPTKKNQREMSVNKK